jgi:hypothetical protein
MQVWPCRGTPPTPQAWQPDLRPLAPPRLVRRRNAGRNRRPGQPGRLHRDRHTPHRQRTARRVLAQLRRLPSNDRFTGSRNGRSGVVGRLLGRDAALRRACARCLFPPGHEHRCFCQGTSPPASLMPMRDAVPGTPGCHDAGAAWMAGRARASRRPPRPPRPRRRGPGHGRAVATAGPGRLPERRRRARARRRLSPADQRSGESTQRPQDVERDPSGPEGIPARARVGWATAIAAFSSTAGALNLRDHPRLGGHSQTRRASPDQRRRRTGSWRRRATIAHIGDCT